MPRAGDAIIKADTLRPLWFAASKLPFGDTKRF